jgi:anti-sigma regulatory factor (Ser/Thr protein kinase)
VKPERGFLMRESWRPDAVFARKLEIAGDRYAPGRVRATVNEMLGGHVGPRLLFDVGVLVSELVTNAVRHGRVQRASTVVVHVALAQEVVRVEVCDQGSGFTPPRPPRARAEGGGNGLVLLDRMSSRWGVAVDDGTCVWFERDLPPAERP